MIVIRDKHTVPRGNFTYTVPETGHRFSSNNFRILVGMARKHMSANAISIPDNLERIVEVDYCNRNLVFCMDTDNPEAGRPGNELLTKITAAVGIPMANALATVTKALGLHCASCAQRHELVKRVNELGFEETVRQVKETFSRK